MSNAKQLFNIRDIGNPILHKMNYTKLAWEYAIKSMEEKRFDDMIRLLIERYPYLQNLPYKFIEELAKKEIERYDNNFIELIKQFGGKK